MLVVDDDPAFLGLATRILKDLGVGVIFSAAGAAQALEVAEERRPDAALVDLGLPDRDGADLAYELSQLPWQPQVVLTSSNSEAFLALEPHDGHRELPFIAKEELASDTLRQALMHG